MSAQEEMYSSEHSDIPVLVPNLQEGHAIPSLSNKSRVSAATGLLFPLVQP